MGGGIRFGGKPRLSRHIIQRTSDTWQIFFGGRSLGGKVLRTYTWIAPPPHSTTNHHHACTTHRPTTHLHHPIQHPSPPHKNATHHDDDVRYSMTSWLRPLQRYGKCTEYNSNSLSITTDNNILATPLVGLLGRCLFGPADARCPMPDADSKATAKTPTPPHVMINSPIQQSAI